MISEEFILNAKIALQLQKLRITTSNRIYSAIVERYIRSHPDYPLLLAKRKDASFDRKETAVMVKKLLKEQLAAIGLEESELNELYEQTLDSNETYSAIVKTENNAFKLLEPELKTQPIFTWFQQVRGLGTKNGIKLLMYIRDIRRFDNPSKLRKYCGTDPGAKQMRGVQSSYKPELKGFMLGQLADNFIKSNSQYKRVYDDKKAYYTRLHPEVLAEKVKGKKLTRDDWTKMKIHRYAIKAMINRFLVELWVAWYQAEGLEPPTTPYILAFPQHSEDPMIVPYVVEAETVVSAKPVRMTKKCRSQVQAGLIEN
jgi:hypothetical protein